MPVNERLVVTAATLVLLAAAPQAAAHPRAERLCFGRAATITSHGEYRINGTPRADVIIGTDTKEEIHGRGGDDRICRGDLVEGGRGNDHIDSDGGGSLDGGAGDDHLVMLPSGSLTKLDGGPGNDVLDAADGYAWAEYHGATRGVKVDLLSGTATGQGHDRMIDVDGIRGTEFDDVLKAGNDADHVWARAGDDEVWARGGDDRVDGAGGSDDLRGGGGKDQVLTGYRDAAPDKADGGRGRDYIEADSGDDVISGGEGNDLVSFLFSSQGVVVDLAAGGSEGEGSASFDGIEGVIGSTFDDELHGDDSGNALWGEGGDDTIDGRAGNDVLGPGEGSDALDGGDGIDRVSYVDVYSSVDIDLSLGTTTEHDGAQDALLSIEDAYGTSEADVITGDEGPNLLFGSWKDDHIDGGGGDDELYGGEGDDALDGGEGADFIDGQAGRDVCVDGERTQSCKPPA
jgi:Ca2+-binding RTX toxin-like protein